MYRDDVRCGKVNHNSNFGVKLSLTTVVLVTLNLLVICAVPYMNDLEGHSRLNRLLMWNDNIKKFKGYCALRGSRCSHLNLNFLSYQRTWSLPRDILCLLYGCVVFVLNWWY